MILTNERKAFISTILCGLLLVIGWLSEILGITIYPYIFILAILIGGFKQTKEGLLDTIEAKHLNVDLLMALAAIGACLIGYFLEGAMLTFIFCLSGALEEYATNKSTKEISNLMQMKPEKALRILANGDTEKVTIETLQIGDTLLVPKGESVPIDGEIIKGQTAIDEAAISGESLPVEKQISDEVFGGTINIGGTFTMTVTKDSQDTLFAKIIQLVDEAQNTPSQTASFIDRIENTYVKIVLVMVPLMILLPYFFLGWDWSTAFYRGMVLLVVASPCALVASATPATLAAISNGAKNGILFKGGIYLENLNALKAIAFDKTGTLTRGKPVVTDAIFLEDDKKQQTINMMVAMENTSTHPLASAIVTTFKDDITDTLPDLIVEDHTGFGLSTQYSDSTWRIGKAEFIETEISSALDWSPIQTLQAAGKTIIYVAENQQIIAYLALLDVAKDNAKGMVQYFKNQRIHTTMITGDHESTAHAIGKELGIDEIHANCLPEEKTNIIKTQKEKYKINGMVGDGINDAPALANAAIGIAMGQGTDVAMDVADVVLMKNDLSKLKMSHQLSKKLKRVVIENISFSVAVILFLVCSNIFQLINLPFGVIGHEGSTILVILNGLRLLRKIK